jgi:aspartate aminotransferase
MEHPVDQITFGAIPTLRDKLLKLQAQGQQVMRLESGDPSFDTPPHIKEAIVEALRQGHTHYSPSAGIPPLRQAIYEKLHRDNGIPIKDPDHILVTNGGMHALHVTFRSLLYPGDEVIIPDPNWTDTANNILLAGGVPVRCSLNLERDFLYEAATIESAITPRTVAIVVNTPHNPTGAVLDRQTLIAILHVAERHNLKIISDEAYEHVIYDGLKHVSIGSLPGAEERVISLFSCSKSYSMAGLRLGYIAANDDLFIQRGKKLSRCTLNGVNSITQHGVVAALNGPQDFIAEVVREYQSRRDLIYESVRQVPLFQPFRPQGTFYLWTRIAPDWEGYQGKRDSWAMTSYLLDRAAIGSTPGIDFGPAGEGYIRFSFSCPRAHIERAAETLKEMFGK